MKTLTLIALFQLCLLKTYGQFQITEISVENDSLSLSRQTKAFYEDESYVVSRSCSGEFGGTIKFKNKQTGVERSCSAVCPVAVNKINDSYFVTNSLAHLAGSAEVVEIKNPETMETFTMPPPRKKKGKVEFRYVGDDESRSTKGSVKLADSIGMNILTSFVYGKELYHITTDFHKTYLSIIKDQKFATVGLVSNERFRLSSESFYYNGSLLIPYKSDNGSGRVEITDNRILIKKFDKN